MEQWASNTLRIIGIILTAGLALVISLFLFLMSMCAYGGDFNGRKNPDQVVPYLLGGVLVMALGVAISVFLARGITQSSTPAVGAVSTAQATPPVAYAKRQPSAPAEEGDENVIEPVVVAMAAQIGLSALVWLWAQPRFWTPPYRLPNHNWALILLTPFILYHTPYAILIYRLRKRLDRSALTYSVAVPAVLILHGLFSASLITLAYHRNPVVVLLIFVPWALHIVVLALAWRAIQHLGIALLPSSLIVAAVVAFCYFSVLQILTPLVYKFAWNIHG